MGGATMYGVVGVGSCTGVLEPGATPCCDAESSCSTWLAQMGTGLRLMDAMDLRVLRCAERGVWSVVGVCVSGASVDGEDGIESSSGVAGESVVVDADGWMERRWSEREG